MELLLWPFTQDRSYETGEIIGLKAAREVFPSKKTNMLLPKSLFPST